MPATFRSCLPNSMLANGVLGGCSGSGVLGGLTCQLMPQARALLRRDACRNRPRAVTRADGPLLSGGPTWHRR
eukprot:10621700-Lingulodinium_polyedra.AAC.1